MKAIKSTGNRVNGIDETEWKKCQREENKRKQKVEQFYCYSRDGETRGTKV